jgi:hypothetical protein
MAVAALRWFKAALLVQLLLLAAWLVTEVVSLYPWNDLASRPPEYDLAGTVGLNALQLIGYMALFVVGVRWLAILSVVGYALFLVQQLWVWWLPYLMGADAEWQATYGRLFARTLKVLPSDSLHLAPDAQHLALQALTIVTLIASAKAAAWMRYL